MRNSIFLLVLLSIAACSSDPPYQLPENAQQLLTADSVKRWKLAYRYNEGTRVNMNPCFLNHRKALYQDGTFADNNGETENCGESMEGRWYIRYDKENRPYLTLQSPLIPKAFGIEKEHKDFEIAEISAEKLVLRFRHAQFTSRPTLFEDTFVPEEVEVADRDFHW